MLLAIRLTVLTVLLVGGSYLSTQFISNTLLQTICDAIWGFIAFAIIITSSWGGQSVMSSFVQRILGKTKG